MLSRLAINNSPSGALSITSENKLHFPEKFDIDLNHVFAAHYVPAGQVVAVTEILKGHVNTASWAFKSIFKRSTSSAVMDISRTLAKDSNDFTSVAVEPLPETLITWETYRMKSLPESLVLKLISNHSSVDANERYMFLLFALDIKQRPVDKSEPRFIVHTFTPAADGSGMRSFALFSELSANIHQVTPKSILVLLNPWGGLKKARSIWSSVVQPMFQLAKVKHTLIETERPLHAADIGESFDIGQYDALITISGDGLFHELLNGIMRRSDWKLVLSTIPLGIIPAGSGNALAKSVDTLFPNVACLNVIKGHYGPFDIFAFRNINSSRIMFGHLEFMWTFIADVDIESDRFRWAGTLRFIFSAVVRLFKLRKYKGKLRYIDRESVVNAPENASRFGLKVIDRDISNTNGWTEVNEKFSYFMAMNMPWCSYDMLPAPFCKPGDGDIHLIWSNGGRRQLLRFLLDTESGTYVNEPYFKSERVHAFILQPEKFSKNVHGIIDVDGELVKFGTYICECMPGTARLFMPADIGEDIWCKTL